MTTRRNLLALAGAIALSAGCASTATRGRSRTPQEEVPATFAPLRWSLSPGDVPALFPGKVVRPGAWGDRERHVTWTIPDARRIAGVPGTLVADWIEGGELSRARLSFEDPRRTCDPDHSNRPQPCTEPGPALSRVYDALQAELASGRGPPQSRGGKVARSASWSGAELHLELTMERDEGGLWWVEASVAPADAAR